MKAIQTRCKLLASVVVALSLGLTACTENAPALDSPYRLTATIQDIMLSQVDPAADFLWASVATIATAAGTETRQPRTDEEWEAVRRNALTLIEATNLLVMEGRGVIAEGRVMEDADLEGVLSPEEIAAAIAGSRPTFIAFAHTLHDAGMEAFTAIEARDADALLYASETLDQACELCHRTYWYPNTAEPIRASDSAP